MYPLVGIFFVGITLNDRKCFYYALPLIAIGLFIAFYQVLLQSHLLPQNMIFCQSSRTSAATQSVSCADIGFKLFDVFTIPQQALIGFSGLLGLGVLGVRSNNI
jgi:hypothetical protein